MEQNKTPFESRQEVIKRLPEGWIHPKKYKKAQIISAVVGIGCFGYGIYKGLFASEDMDFVIILVMSIALIIADYLIMAFYASKENMDLSRLINIFWYTLNASTFVSDMDGILKNNLSHETEQKVKLFKAWVMYLMGQGDEGRKIVADVKEDKFLAIQNLSLLAMVEVNMLENPEQGYAIIDQYKTVIIDSVDLSARKKQGYIGAIESQKLRIDMRLAKEVPPLLIEKVKAKQTDLDDLSNKILLMYYNENRDVEQSRKYAEEVIKDCQELVQFKLEAQSLLGRLPTPSIVIEKPVEAEVIAKEIK